MEKIGDREAAIADRVRALLEAANSTAAAVAGTVVPSAGVVRSASAPVTRSSRRLDPGSCHSRGQLDGCWDPAGGKLINFPFDLWIRFCLRSFSPGF